jgi:hypothetical protein
MRTQQCGPFMSPADSRGRSVWEVTPLCMTSFMTLHRLLRRVRNPAIGGEDNTPVNRRRPQRDLAVKPAGLKSVCDAGKDVGSNGDTL